MKILVLGGTGAIGGFLVDMLDSKKDQIYVTSRKNMQSSNNISYIKGNAHNLDFISSIICDRNWDVIIDFMNYELNEFKERFELFLKNTSQYIFLSSSRVFADTELINENSSRLLETVKDKSFIKSKDYALNKAKEEDLLKNSGFKNWTIIRPYMSYSPYRLDLGFYSKELWLYRVLHNQKIIFPKDVASRVTSLTYGGDVAKMIIPLLGNSSALGNIYNLSSCSNYTWNDIINIYKTTLKELGYDMDIVWVNHPPIEDEFIYKYDRNYNRRFDLAKISALSKNLETLTPQKGISSCIRTFIQNPSFKQIDWKKQAFWDSITNEHTSLNLIPSFKLKLFYILFRYLISYKLVYNIKHKIQNLL